MKHWLLLSLIILAGCGSSGSGSFFGGSGSGETGVSVEYVSGPATTIGKGSSFTMNLRLKTHIERQTASDTEVFKGLIAVDGVPSTRNLRSEFTVSPVVDGSDPFPETKSFTVTNVQSAIAPLINYCYEQTARIAPDICYDPLFRGDGSAQPSCVFSQTISLNNEQNNDVYVSQIEFARQFDERNEAKDFKFILTLQNVGGGLLRGGSNYDFNECKGQATVPQENLEVVQVTLSPQAPFADLSCTFPTLGAQRSGDSSQGLVRLQGNTVQLFCKGKFTGSTAQLGRLRVDLDYSYLKQTRLPTIQVEERG